MSSTAKLGFKLFLILVVVCLLTLAMNWQQASRLYKTITLFDEAVIVDNFIHMDSIFNTLEIVSETEPHYFEEKQITYKK